MKVAVVGATGLVGTKMLQVLAERNFPVSELVPVASEKSVGKEVEFRGNKYKVVSMTDAIAAKPAVAIFLREETLRWNGHPNLLKQGLRLSIIHRRGEWIPQNHW